MYCFYAFKNLLVYFCQLPFTLSQLEYIFARRKDKKNISIGIVNEVERLGGRFLDKDKNGIWFDIGCEKSVAKVSQALREQQPDLKKNTTLVDESTNEPLPQESNVKINGLDIEHTQKISLLKPMLRRRSSFPPTTSISTLYRGLIENDVFDDVESSENNDTTRPSIIAYDSRQFISCQNSLENNQAQRNSLLSRRSSGNGMRRRSSFSCLSIMSGIDFEYEIESIDDSLFSLRSSFRSFKTHSDNNSDGVPCAEDVTMVRRSADIVRDYFCKS